MIDGGGTTKDTKDTKEETRGGEVGSTADHEEVTGGEIAKRLDSLDTA